MYREDRLLDFDHAVAELARDRIEAELGACQLLMLILNEPVHAEEGDPRHSGHVRRTHRRSRGGHLTMRRRLALRRQYNALSQTRSAVSKSLALAGLVCLAQSVRIALPMECVRKALRASVELLEPRPQPHCLRARLTYESHVRWGKTVSGFPCVAGTSEQHEPGNGQCQQSEGTKLPRGTSDVAHVLPVG